MGVQIWLASAWEVCEASMEEVVEVGGELFTSCLRSHIISSWPVAILSWTHLRIMSTVLVAIT